jgi:hypothetical protein
MRAHTQEQAEDDSVWQGALAQRNAREQAHERAQATAAEHNMMMMMRVLANMGPRRDAGLLRHAFRCWHFHWQKWLETANLTATVEQLQVRKAAPSIPPQLL